MNKKSKVFNFLYIRAHKGNIVFLFLYNLYTKYILGCDIKASTKIGTGFEIFHKVISALGSHALYPVQS